MMTSGFNLLDLMTVPPLMRRILRALLRHQVLIEDQLWMEVTRTRDDAVFDRAALQKALRDLARRGWLTQQSVDESVAYSICMRHSDRQPSDARIAAGQVLEQVEDSQRYRIELSALTAEETSPATPMRNADVLDGLMHRGGKRTLPKNIWDKLGSSAAPADESPTSPADEAPVGKKIGKDLLNLF